MELKTLMRTLLRRWPMCLVVLVLAGAGTYVVARDVGPTYETVGSALVFPPADADGTGPNPPGGNPYLELGGLTQARDIVIRTMTSKSVRAEIDAAHPGVSFDATPDFTNSAPIILFTVEAGSPATSTEALYDLMDRVPTTLADLQEGQALTDRSRITSLALTEDLEPDIHHKDQIRAAILVAAGILGAGLLLIALVDGLLAGRARRARRARGGADAAGPEAGTEPESESGSESGPDTADDADDSHDSDGADDSDDEEQAERPPARLVSVREIARARDRRPEPSEQEAGAPRAKVLGSR